MTTVHVLAPAKVNLGLEVIGKRADGYHEIATVMQTVSVFDRLTATVSDALSLHVSDPILAGNDNLALTAARELRRYSSSEFGASITLTKRVPTAAGLGGASSDAAATLFALSRLWNLNLVPEELHAAAARIGSDVPFFLKGGTALVQGRGDILTRIRHPARVWYVLVAPLLNIPRKTATLYAALTTDDYSSGDRMRRLALDLSTGDQVEPTLLANAFRRPLLALRPEVAHIEDVLLQAGSPFVALSGAGPAHYTVVAGLAQARSIARSVRRALGDKTRVLVCRPVTHVPLISADDG